MTYQLDETHHPARRSFVASANVPGCEFPIQNLPFCVFSRKGETPRPGMAIGDQILDLSAVAQDGLLDAALAETIIGEATLNQLFALGRGPLRSLRRRISGLLDAGSADRERLVRMLAAIGDCALHRPTNVANYTDFYAGMHHARAAGALLTPENPLPANYKWVPIAYHGRASSVQLGNGNVRRPSGQRGPLIPGGPPTFGQCERLDFELEMGFYVGGGNTLGNNIAIGDASDHIVGFSLLNDWSARDLQRWEMFPLGPFLSKSFATSVSPWVVTSDALAPFRVSAMVRPEGDPQPLDYLNDAADQARGGLDVHLRVSLQSERMRQYGMAAHDIIHSNARYLYWTPAQMVAHHTINGCNLLPGDLIGTGTISGPTRNELSSMLELTTAGAHPVVLPSGENRSFLQDGDHITFHGRCERDGFVPIGFGTCHGSITPAWSVRSQIPA